METRGAVRHRALPALKPLPIIRDTTGVDFDEVEALGDEISQVRLVCTSLGSIANKMQSRLVG